MKTCINCGKEFDGGERAKYCSDKCKVAFNRKVKSGETPLAVEVKKPKTDDWMTFTDKLFEVHNPGYYTYDKEEHTGKCYICKLEFTSHLELLKFCSPEHQQLFLNTVTDQYKPHSLGV